MNSTTSHAVFNDLGALTNLKARSNGGDTAGALKETAKQFEAIFLNMMLKQMRESSFGDPLFDSDAGNSYRAMFDQQLALNLSDKGSLGIAKLIENQLGGQVTSRSAENENPFKPLSFVAPKLNNNVQYSKPQVIVDTVKPAPVINNEKKEFTSVEDFVTTIWPHAEKAAKQLGIPTETLVSQAALETGWGKHMIKGANGQASFNLFGIKADSRWGGDVVSIKTTEYRDGIVQKEQANFRAYDSLAKGFEDYVSFIKTSPRYSEALNSRGNPAKYLNNLQQGGYATDPAYANKIQGIMQGDTLLSAKSKLDS